MGRGSFLREAPGSWVYKSLQVEGLEGLEGRGSFLKEAPGSWAYKSLQGGGGRGSFLNEARGSWAYKSLRRATVKHQVHEMRLKFTSLDLI